MNFKVRTNFTYTRSLVKITKSSIKLGSFGFGLPVPIKTLEIRTPTIEKENYVWRFDYRGAKYVISTPVTNVEV